MLELKEIFDFVGDGIIYYIIFILPVYIALSPSAKVYGAHDFSVHRLQQFDLQGFSRGSRNSLLNMEARGVNATNVHRKCVVAKLTDLSIDKVNDLISLNAGGLLVIMPSSLIHLSTDQRNQFLRLEDAMLKTEISIPVYFTQESDSLLNILSSVKEKDDIGYSTATEALLGSVFSNGYQLVVSGGAPKPMVDASIINIQGKLAGAGIEDQLPTIAFVSHYDSFGASPGLSYGTDSNASGVSILLELARVFSQLYSNPKSHPKMNMLFLLSGGGKLNFQGTKRWLEDQIDGTEGSLVQDLQYAVCLDTLGGGDTIYIHVSKPPKEGGEVDLFFKKFTSVAAKLYPEVKLEIVHKKINLNSDLLSWEHERFSIRRLSAFSVSHLQSANDLHHNTILDTVDTLDMAKLFRNTRILTETVAQVAFNLSSDKSVLDQNVDLSADFLKAWMTYLSSVPRSSQHAASRSSSLVVTLESALQRYLEEVKVSVSRADKREPEYMLFDGMEGTMTAYHVRAEVFDLFLSIAIAIYLLFIYLFLRYFAQFYVVLRKISYLGSTRVKVS